MSRIITFSRTYPSYHPKAGQPTHFVEKILHGIWPQVDDKWMDATSMTYDLNKRLPEDVVFDFLNLCDRYTIFDPKHHTVRAGYRWKAGDWFSPVCWGNDINPKSRRSGPYHSKQIKFAPDIQIVKTWDFDIEGTDFYLDGKHQYALTGEGFDFSLVAKNDGLNSIDLHDWFCLSPDFKKKQAFNGQIICWSDKVNYD